MKKNYDDLYNKFIDNDLTNEERKEIEVLLKTDKNFSLGLKAHKFVHNTLFDLGFGLSVLLSFFPVQPVVALC